MAHPGDVSALASLIDAGELRARDIVAFIGKTEGNGGVNDFTRGYFTQSLMALLARHTGEPAEALAARIPCVLSGGTEGVLSPHFVVFARHGDAPAQPVDTVNGSLAIGTAFTDPLPAEAVGRWAQVESVAAAVRAAMNDAGLTDPREIEFVQVKCPCITSARVQDAAARGQTVVTTDANRSMALSRAAGAFGIALALGELPASATDADLLADFAVACNRASVSSGVEVTCNEVIVLGNSTRWSGPLRIAHAPMRDALDLPAVGAALDRLGIAARPQVDDADRDRIAAVLVKCEPDRRGQIRGARHTMLDDTDINAQRHIRGAVGALVAGVMGDGRLFVSGGAEHQGPDGGGLVAVIAAGRA
ncbi:cyanuric acid amidohydrolase [Pigmentiphaga litoralis]|uniref:Cyclic amide hydrolase n=2 Tax=Pigmentiphaga litoralis TaxID=516702 RepID=A0A7Y9IVI8_9BURK|nr:cyanuric acid amidohydrolase [Pigmentiphaga litoralis]NYE83733.1 cyanuric acid amidohydrolase [Pigmentiphaga litoralis]